MPRVKEPLLWIAGFFIMKRIEYKKGEKIGECVYLEESPKRKSNGVRRALFQCQNCEAKIEFEATISQVKSLHTKSCGCRSIEMAVLTNTKHGQYYRKTYSNWEGIIRRCHDENFKQYKDYGGRGITVYNKWIKEPKLLLDYIELLPDYGKENYTLDRINNNGNYEPGNLRWANRHVQQANHKKSRKNKSGYTGVFFYKNMNKWGASIRVNHETFNLGYYEDIKDAAIARNNYITKNQLFEYPIQKIILK